jgi:septal ring factor EnvC (AmiA/AmiB activator)
MGRTVLIVALLISLVGPAVGEETRELDRRIDSSKGDLTEVQRELKKKQQMVRKKSREEKKTLRLLSSIDRKLAGKKKELRKLTLEIQEREHKIAEQESAVRELEGRRSFLHGALRSRVAAMYKLHRVGMIRALFSAEDYVAALRSYKIFDLITEHDLEVLDGYRNTIVEGRKKHEQLTKERNALLGKKAEAEGKRKEILRERRKRSAVLAKIKSDKRTYAGAVAELKAREQDLHALVEQLRTKKISLKGGSFSLLKGSLGLPVSGAVFTPQGRRKGIGIRAPEGAEVKAPFRGVVAYASWLDGYGNLLIIDHGDAYHTVLAHASHLLRGVGDEVKMGDVVALVGSTGSLEGSMLYFEIRYRGRAQDTLSWLALRRNTEG